MDSTNSDTSSPPSPLCDYIVLQDLSSGIIQVPASSAPDKFCMSPSENNLLDDNIERSLSTEDTWTLSIEGEESEDNIDLDGNGSIWQESH